MVFDIVQYVLLGLFLLIVITCIGITIKNAVKKKNKEPKKATPVEIKDNVRYTKSDIIENEQGDAQISYVKNDIILQPRKVVTVGKKSLVKPGKYTVLSAYESEDEFNIRIGNFVKSYTHGQEIVLADGDEICPTSSTIILR